MKCGRKETMYDNIAIGTLVKEQDNDEDFGAVEGQTRDYWDFGAHHEHDEEEEARKNVFDDIMDAALQLVTDDGVRALLEEADEKARGEDETGFMCKTCGLHHGHETWKHDIRRDLGVTKRFARKLHYEAYCHCAVNELHMMLDFFGHIDEQVFVDEDEPDFDITERRRQVASAARSAKVGDHVHQKILELRNEMQDRVN